VYDVSSRREGMMILSGRKKSEKICQALRFEQCFRKQGEILKLDRKI